VTTARVIRAAGALAEIAPLRDACLNEIVRVGDRGLLGEVIRLRGDVATVQIFEDTSGLALEETVRATGQPLRAELGPGLLGAVLDGTGRPLSALAAAGDFVIPGTVAATLDRSRQWRFTPRVGVGDRITGGDVIGVVEERPGFEHRIMLPPAVAGRVAAIAEGDYRIEQPLGRLEDGTPLRLIQEWPVRIPRPIRAWCRADRPFVTGQRVFDLLFPVAEGGAVAVPGGFGTGKTVIEQSLAKFADADVVVYVGCGERGNEMADLLEGFPALEDPRTGRSLMDRTVMVVNTSNMPVAAREASVYMGLTIAEYWRDMGYRVALMADSLSRWAEALREIGSLLHEMPGEEGYPTALGNRLGKLFERAGRVTALGKPAREGAVTFISALSPPGGDFAEPVTQSALRVAGALWALDASLAHQRQFPAVDWETSYSLQVEAVATWFEREVGADWPDLRRATLELLQRDRELREIAGLVGPEALEDKDRLVLESARILREGVLGQSAYDPNDAFSSVRKTYLLAGMVIGLHRRALEALGAGAGFATLDLARAHRAVLTLRQAAGDEVDAVTEAARLEIGRAIRIPGGVG
jgi:V/A-type H+-transporting ATPase subunit A